MNLFDAIIHVLGKITDFLLESNNPTSGEFVIDSRPKK